MVAQHRLVTKVLKKDIGEIHGLKLKTVKFLLFGMKSK